MNRVKYRINRFIGLAGNLLPIQTALQPDDARKCLQNYSPKPMGTCVADNKVAIGYDLQIIVPAYNAERYILQCVYSILNQKTSYNVLISIVNDGSTDGTLDILQKVEQEINVSSVNNTFGGGMP